MAKCSETGSSGVISVVDRLSALPDGLIHTVMSFLPAPEVVRTCALSRRWRNLWRSARCTNIDEEDFGISLMIRRDNALELEEKWARFENFATNLQLFHDNTSSLGEFRLASCAYNQRHMDRWIRCGIDLDLGSHFAGLLCSACPVMKDLKLEYCEFSGISSQAITSSTLKKLELASCENTGYPLVITAPSLAYLLLDDGGYGADISLCKMDSLVEANIFTTSNVPEKTQHELLGSLFNVTRLELREFEAEVMLFEKSDKFPVFRNMQTLGLCLCFLHEGGLKDKLEVLGSFIQNAPCLEKLTLDNCMFPSFFYSDSDIGRKNITLKCQDRKTFQCHKLKLIKVIYDRDHDQRLIEFVWSLERSFPDVNIELIKDD